jgi:hypothetical protein
MRWMGHVERIEGGVAYRALMGKQEVDHFGNLSISGTIILKWISNRWGGFDYIRLSQRRYK